MSWFIVFHKIILPYKILCDYLKKSVSWKLINMSYINVIGVKICKHFFYYRRSDKHHMKLTQIGDLGIEPETPQISGITIWTFSNWARTFKWKYYISYTYLCQKTIFNTWRMRKYAFFVIYTFMIYAGSWCCFYYWNAWFQESCLIHEK